MRSSRLPAVKRLADFDFTFQEAETKGPLRRRLRALTHPALLVVDEIGYLPVTRTGKTLFFQLINERYERASTVPTPNKAFEEWEAIVGDEVMAAALLDRLLRHCQIVNIRGNSYRMRQRSDLAQALPQVPARKNPEQGRLPKPRRPGEAARASGAGSRSLRSLRPRPTRPSRNSPPATYPTATPPDPVNPPLRRHPITPKKWDIFDARKWDIFDAL